jgi:hypothetical protein
MVFRTPRVEQRIPPRYSLGIAFIDEEEIYNLVLDPYGTSFQAHRLIGLETHRTTLRPDLVETPVLSYATSYGIDEQDNAARNTAMIQGIIEQYLRSRGWKKKPCWMLEYDSVFDTDGNARQENLCHICVLFSPPVS